MQPFLTCVAEAVAARGFDSPEQVAAEVIRRSDSDLAAELKAVVRADLKTAVAAARDAAGGDAKLEAYLSRVAGVARHALRRPQDPSGLTVPASLNLHDAVQLGTLLPRRVPAFRTGDTLPHSDGWRLAHLLGSGDLGEVWLATLPAQKKYRAVKFCTDDAVRDLLRSEEGLVKRVAEAAADLKPAAHGAAKLLDFNLDGETPWLAYDFVDAGDLAGLARQLMTLSPAERGKRAVGVLKRLAGVVGHFHRRPLPIVHGDLKPTNVLFKKHGDRWLIRVTDYGVGHLSSAAALTTDNAVDRYRGAHTPLYASPQQRAGDPAEVRDDVYALGVMGYQLLTGDMTARPAADWRDRVADCDLTPAVLDLLEQCWAADPADRPADAVAVAETLAEPVAKTATAPAVDVEDLMTRGMKLDQGDGVPQDSEAAMRLFREAADAGHARAMHVVSWMHHTGRGVPQDAAEAAAWLRKAADAGHGPAMFQMGERFRVGDGEPQDSGQALAWHLKAAATGHAAAMNAVGWAHQEGQGTPVSAAEAVTWFRKSAEAGHLPAMHNLGWLILNPDAAEAMRWFRTAADGGHAPAMAAVGLLYRDGQGVAKDYAKAMRWLHLAADAGHADALYDIAHLHAEGRGMRQDYAAAMHWFRLAADAGIPAAMFNVGLLYEHAMGVPKNVEAAKAWYQHALNAGHAEAAEAIGQLSGGN